MIRRLAPFAAVAALTLTGCGSDEADPESASATSSSGSSSSSDATSTTECPPAKGATERVTSFDSPPPMCIDPKKTYVATLATDAGDIEITLDAKAAPKTVNNFVVLSKYNFYDGLTFHRVIKNFMAQGGDPKGDGTGGPGYTFEDELPKPGEYEVGSVAMANSGPDTNGSQFFIVTGPAGEQLPPKYSLFGQVTDGQDVVARIAADGSSGEGQPATVHTIDDVTISQE